MTDFRKLDLSRLKTSSIHERKSKVDRTGFASPWKKGGRFGDFLANLPGILAAEDFIKIADAIATAVRDGRLVMLGMGGHVIKVGLSPLIVDLMERGIIKLIAVNGSVMVHDAELAMVGATSEDVAAGLGDGSFGVTREANALINQAARKAADTGIGMGRALGDALLEQDFPYNKDSVFAAGARLGVPITVHMAMGTDVYHIHPDADGAALGKAGLDDFHSFCSAVSQLEKGVYINLGSAVILPEVFLKAITLVRNLGYSLKDITTVNMDFIRQYRPQVNVVSRPTAEGGQGFSLVGHHELMFPLLCAAVIERID
jgi:hypothetical protein